MRRARQINELHASIFRFSFDQCRLTWPPPEFPEGGRDDPEPEDGCEGALEPEGDRPIDPPPEGREGGVLPPDEGLGRLMERGEPPEFEEPPSRRGVTRGPPMPSITVRGTDRPRLDPSLTSLRLPVPSESTRPIDRQF